MLIEDMFLLIILFTASAKIAAFFAGNDLDNGLKYSSLCRIHFFGKNFPIF